MVIKIEKTNVKNGQAGESFPFENESDEKDIINDNDETLIQTLGNKEEDDQDPGAAGGDPSQKDIKDLMDHNIRSMNASTGRPPLQDISQDEAENSENGDIFSLKISEQDQFKNTVRGHETGAFTDIGEGRSSVTRQLKKNRPKKDTDKNY